MKYPLPPSEVVPGHEDYELLNEILQFVLSKFGSHAEFKSEFGLLLRKAFDAVIDTPMTKRTSLDQLEKTEKTYLGTKIEIQLRSKLGVEKGRLDLRIKSHDVDVKFTVGSNWMIPTEAIGSVCIVIAADEGTGLFSFGAFVAAERNLSTATNRDLKRSIPKAQFINICWLASGEPYPKGFWSSVNEPTAKYVLSGGSGADRLFRLFSKILEIPIPRSVIEDVAQQKDYMKRLRKNGGARDFLERASISLYSGKYDSKKIEDLGLPHCDAEHFISTKQ